MAVTQTDLVEGVVQTTATVSTGEDRDGAPAVEVRIGRAYAGGGVFHAHHFQDPEALEALAHDLLTAADFLREAAALPLDGGADDGSR